MLLISHIIIALLSLVAAAAAFFKPSQVTLRASYILVGLTLASGTALVITLPAHLMQTCVTGLTYLAFVFSAILAARHKLVRG
ncbi:MAG: hypothetical protein NVSMB39_4460 [Candidatus Saccharimonadales bacterium]